MLQAQLLNMQQLYGEPTMENLEAYDDFKGKVGQVKALDSACAIKGGSSIYNMTEIAAPTGSNLYYDQELFYYRGNGQEILMNLCDETIRQSNLPVIKGASSLIQQ